MRNTKERFIGLFFLLAYLLGACAARPIHPGAVNAFDSSAYDALLVADSIIQSTKADLTNNVFSATVAANVKTALNGLITAYDAADVAYKAYHAAAVAGSATAAQQQAVSTSLSNVSTATSTLVNAKAGK